MAWRKHWTCLSPAMESPETDELVDFFFKQGIQQNWWTTYGGIRSVLMNMCLDIGKPQVFHHEKYVGSTLEEVKTYIYTLKRIHGEI